jgi:serine/threonine-protein kinase PknG
VLPRPLIDSDDPAAGYLATITATDPEQMIAELLAAPERTAEVALRHAAELIDAGRWASAGDALAEVEEADRWDWRVRWYRGVADLAGERAELARASFENVYRSLPGELAPKLALGFVDESAGAHNQAARWYEIVSRTDPAFTAAAFGLARCRLAAGDRDGALAAYDRIPDFSSDYIDAQTARIRCLAAGKGRGTTGDLLTAGSILESLPVAGEQRARLTAEVLEAAIALTGGGAAFDDGASSLLGCRFSERDLRFGVERSYRELARWTPSISERIELVDRANQIRPRTWT